MALPTQSGVFSFLTLVKISWLTENMEQKDVAKQKCCQAKMAWASSVVAQSTSSEDFATVDIPKLLMLEISKLLFGQLTN